MGDLLSEPNPSHRVVVVMEKIGGRYLHYLNKKMSLILNGLLLGSSRTATVVRKPEHINNCATELGNYG